MRVDRHTYHLIIYAWCSHTLKQRRSVRVCVEYTASLRAKATFGASAVYYIYPVYICSAAWALGEATL